MVQILRKEWGFDGAVVTDWGGSNNHALGVKHGSTLEMPAPGGDSVRELLAAVQSGKISENDVDARLKELLPLIFDTRAALDKAPKQFDEAAHHELAHRATAESLVLLKNEDSFQCSYTMFSCKQSDIECRTAGNYGKESTWNLRNGYTAPSAAAKPQPRCFPIL